jgi:hypothetical protein
VSGAVQEEEFSSPKGGFVHDVEVRLGLAVATVARDRCHDGKGGVTMTGRLLRLGVVLTAAAAAMLGYGPSASADPTLHVSVTGARLAPGGQQVVLTGEYMCGPFSPDSDGVVDLTVVQATTPVDTTGYGYLYLTVCDGSMQDWSAPVDSVGAPFVRGRAQVSGSGYACDRGPTGGCAFGSFGPTGMRIR